MNRKRTLTLCLLAAITLLAAFLRLYRIDSLPPSDGYDQATYGLDVLDILDGARPVFLPTNFGREALFSYLVTLVYLLYKMGGGCVCHLCAGRRVCNSGHLSRGFRVVCG